MIAVAGLDPAIHVLQQPRFGSAKTWMVGTSPAKGL
jgi:hypothetical protein